MKRRTFVTTAVALFGIRSAYGEFSPQGGGLPTENTAADAFQKFLNTPRDGAPGTCYSCSVEFDATHNQDRAHALLERYLEFAQVAFRGTRWRVELFESNGQTLFPVYSSSGAPIMSRAGYLLAIPDTL